MNDIERIKEAKEQARQRCAKCGEERQSHAFVQGVYGALWICQLVIFIAQEASPQEQT